MTTTFSLTAEDALANLQSQLNVAMTQFDRWVSQNPLHAVPSNVEYRLKQQEIKMIKLKINETKEMKDNFDNTLMVLSSAPVEVDQTPTQFTRSKGLISTNQQSARLGAKKTDKLSTAEPQQHVLSTGLQNPYNPQRV